MISPLPFAAGVTPAILALTLFRVERVPPRLLARSPVIQDARHSLGVKGQDEATVGPCLQRRRDERLSSRGDQGQERRILRPSWGPQGAGQAGLIRLSSRAVGQE